MIQGDGVGLHAPVDGAQVIDCAVAGHGQQPGSQRALFGVEGVHAIPHTEEGFLHQILGHRRVPHDAEDQRIGQPPVAVVKLGHGLGMVGFQAAHEVAILGEAHRKL